MERDQARGAPGSRSRRWRRGRQVREIMPAVSVRSTIPDPYRAGAELGEGLSRLQPEVVLVFASVDYVAGYADLHAGLCDGIGGAPPLVFGGTGDGVMATAGMVEHGVAALGLHSGGRVRWATVATPGAARDARAAAGACAREARAAVGGAVPAFAFVLAGMSADGTGIVAGVADELGGPFFGGLTGDDRRFARCHVFLGGQALEDAVAMLVGAGGPTCALNAASGWTPIGRPGRVEVAAGNVLARIGGMPAQAFLREQLGKAPGELDLGVVPLAAATGDDDGQVMLRTPSHFAGDSGAITIYGSIPDGTEVRVCQAARQDVLAGVDAALAGLRDPGFTPTAAVVVSCAGRKWVLADQAPQEIERVFAALGRRLPLVGFPSFGEIGPFRGPDGRATRPCFHNVTFVVGLLGV